MSLPEFGVDSSRPLKVPALSILITVVGSRGELGADCPRLRGLTPRFLQATSSLSSQSPMGYRKPVTESDWAHTPPSRTSLSAKASSSTRSAETPPT